MHGPRSAPLILRAFAGQASAERAQTRAHRPIGTDQSDCAIRAREAACDTKLFEVKSKLEFVVAESVQKERECVRQMREAAERELSASKVEFSALKKAVLDSVGDAVQREKAARKELAESRLHCEEKVSHLAKKLEEEKSAYDHKVHALEAAVESKNEEIVDLKHREEALAKEVSDLKVEAVRQAADSNRLLSSAQSETEQIRAQMEAELEQEKGKVVSLNKSLADEIHEWSSTFQQRLWHASGRPCLLVQR